MIKIDIEPDLTEFPTIMFRFFPIDASKAI